MKGFGATLWMLTLIAMRNLVASRLKTLIIGGIILFGAILVVVGSSTIDSVEKGMSRSIQGSVAGHIQIYSSKSRDELALWGNMGGDSDLSAIDDFAKIRGRLETIPNVERVVPMGISGAIIQSGNTMDVKLAELRALINQKLSGNISSQTDGAIQSLKQHIRYMAQVLREDFSNLNSVLDASAIDPEVIEALDRTKSDAYWNDFDSDPLNSLEFLENRVAPQATDADLVFIRYIGTEMGAFTQSFDRIRIVDGESIPEGKRGFLFAKFFYEDRLKLRTARRLDKIKEAITEQKKSIAGDPELQRFIKSNIEQVREIVLQLDPIKTQTAVNFIQRELNSTDDDIAHLLAAFFELNDQNFLQRYELFYKQLVPLLELYRIRVGDTFTIKAFTRTGFVQSVNVKVYGTFEFNGLEKSALAGNLNLMDLISFRDLYGHLTSEKAAEFADIKAKVGATDISRESAEDALFGGDSTLVAEAVPTVIDDLDRFDGNARMLRQEEMINRVYSIQEMEEGVVLNAAIILKNPDTIPETIAAISALSDKESLGLKAVSWQQASGMVGQFIVLLKVILYVSVLIIFVVALVIINNAMMMATLERVREIGTLRAIGAQRTFVLKMLLIETIVIGTLFGSVGALIGVFMVQGLQHLGIPATSDIMYFLFSGPTLRLELASENLLAALIIVLIVSALASFYPALLASRISPLQAMQTED